MNQSYLVPANSKKQTLIFGFMLPVDLIIMCIAIVVSFILLLTMPVDQMWALVVALLPLMTAATLVFPIPNYHNTRIFIREMFNFFRSRRKYIWRGWCYKYEQSDDK